MRKYTVYRDMANHKIQVYTGSYWQCARYIENSIQKAAQDLKEQSGFSMLEALNEAQTRYTLESGKQVIAA